MRNLVFARFTNFIHDTEVVVNPQYVAAVDGNYIHLNGGVSISVKEDHEEIMNRLQEAERWANGAVPSQTSERSSGLSRTSEGLEG